MLNIKIKGYGSYATEKVIYRDWKGETKIEQGYTHEVAWVDWLVYHFKTSRLMIPISEEILYHYTQRNYAIDSLWGKIEQVYLYTPKQKSYVRITRQAGAENLWCNLKKQIQQVEKQWAESLELEQVRRRFT